MYYLQCPLFANSFVTVSLQGLSVRWPPDKTKLPLSTKARRTGLPSPRPAAGHVAGSPRRARPACDRLELLRRHLSLQGAAPDAGGKMLPQPTGRVQTPGVRRRQKRQHRLSRLVVVAVRIALGVGTRRRPCIVCRTSLSPRASSAI